MGIESYATHQLNYFEHVNMQEVRHNNYYTNRALSISRPLEVLTVIHDKMDHVKTTSPCFANRIKATDGFFKLHVWVTCEFGNDCITYPKHNIVCFLCVHGDIDVYKMNCLKVYINPLSRHCRNNYTWTR